MQQLCRQVMHLLPRNQVVFHLKRILLPVEGCFRAGEHGCGLLFSFQKHSEGERKGRPFQLLLFALQGLCKYFPPPGWWGDTRWLPSWSHFSFCIHLFFFFFFFNMWALLKRCSTLDALKLNYSHSHSLRYWRSSAAISSQRGSVFNQRTA